MILLVQRYTVECERRAAELRRCLEENEASGVFEKIDVIDGDEKRMTFREMFALAGERHPGQKCVVANSDISFRHISCSVVLHKAISENWLVALTRWHDDATPWMVGLHIGNRWYSGTQDAWGFVAGSFAPFGDFPMGEPGCDCRLTAAAVNAGVPVWNPALTIRTMHVHEELNNTTRPSPPGDYGYVELTTVESFGGVAVKTFPDTNLVVYTERARSV